jgi:hypothetical protein
VRSIAKDMRSIAQAYSGLSEGRARMLLRTKRAQARKQAGIDSSALDHRELRSIALSQVEIPGTKTEPKTANKKLIYFFFFFDFFFYTKA